MSKKKKPIEIKVGVGVVVWNIDNPDEFLMTLRLNSRRAGVWALPGGKLEPGETIFQCAVREVKEECNLDMIEGSLKLFPEISQELYRNRNEQFITHYVEGICSRSSVLQNMEPHKHQEWRWFTKDTMPSPVWYPTDKIILGEEYPHALLEFNGGEVTYKP